MASDDQVLLRLVIKGMDPSEVQRLAQQTYGTLKNEASQILQQLTDLHKQKQQAMEDAAKTVVDDQIKQQQKLLGAVQQVMRQQEIEVNRVKGAYDRWLERLENITVAATGFWNVVTGGFGRLKDLGEEIDHVTNIYGSLKGSIDQLREASMGEISDRDLVIEKNRAWDKELHLTDEQLGVVAASADRFADSIGVNTKEALDKLVDGLATGRIKMLQHAGIILNTQQVYADFAKSIGSTSDKLSDEGKRLALTQAALQKMDEQLINSGQATDDFAHRWEQLMATLQNAKDHILLPLGEALVKVETGILHGSEILEGNLKILQGKLLDSFTGGAEHFEDQARAALGKLDESISNIDGKARDAAQKRLAQGAEAYRQLNEVERQYEAIFGPGSSLGRNIGRDSLLDPKKVEEYTKKVDEARAAVQKLFDQINGVTKEQREIDPLEAVLFVDKGDKAKLVADYLKHGEAAIQGFYRQVEASRQEFIAKGGFLPDPKKTLEDLTANIDTILRGRDAIEQRLKDVTQQLPRGFQGEDQPIGQGGERLRTEEEIKRLQISMQDQLTESTKKYADVLKTVGDRKEKIDETNIFGSQANVEAQKKRVEEYTKTLEKVAKAREEAVSRLSESAGGEQGFLIPVIFKVIGTDATIDQINQVKTVVDDMSSITAAAAHQFTEAMADSIVASIAGSAAAKKHFQTVTHDILASLATQAIAHALWETALGIGDLALYAESYGADGSKAAAAATHFEAAAAFGILGGAAALGARAVGINSADVPGASSNSGISRGSGSSTQLGSSSSLTSGPGGSNAQPVNVTINQTVLPGGEPEAGRQVAKSLKAAFAQTGVSITGSI